PTRPSALCSLSLHDALPISLSLSAMEAELKPQVVETFDRIANAYGQMREMQDRHAEDRSASVSDADTKKLDVLRGEVIADVKSLDRKSTRLNSSHVKISYAV